MRPRDAGCAAFAVTGLIAATLVCMSATTAPTAVLPEVIAADTTLTAADSPWELISNVLIEAGVTVTVEPDVIVMAHGDYRLTVSGTLTAMSPMGTRIVFRAPDTDASGVWRGLYFTSGSTGRFQRCTFRSARDNILADSADVRLYNCHVRRASRDGLYAWGNSFIKTAYCRFQNNGRYGVHLQTSEPEGAIIFSQFIGSGEHPVRLKANVMEMLRRGNTFEYNAISAIGVDCGSAVDITDTDVWRDQGLPLDLTVGSDTSELVIAEGATLRIKSGLRIYPPRRIVVRGRLLLDGLPDARVVIQPQGDATRGQWLGIELEPRAVVRAKVATVGFGRDGFVLDDAHLYINNVVIRDCEHDGVYAAGTSHVDAAGCTVFDCGYNGFHLPQQASTGKIHTTRVTRCGRYPVRIASTVAEALRHGNSYADNGHDAIGVMCGAHPDIRDDDAWLPQGVPFDLTAEAAATTLRVRDGGRLSLRSGVEVAGGTISVAGVFVAAGTGDEPVVFDAPEGSQSPGGWTGIEYVGAGAGRLVNAHVRHAETGVLVQSSGYIRLVGSTFEHCSADGVRLARSAWPIISGCTMRFNEGRGIAVTGSATPTLGSTDNPGRNSFYGNATYDLANLTSAAVLAQRNWWGTTDQAEIAQHIFDEGDDPAYGPVNWAPFLNSQPTGASSETVIAAQDAAGPIAILGLAAAPAADGASIHVSLSRPTEVCVTLRNIAGREVRRLHRGIDETRGSAGCSQAVIPWDGRDARGSCVPSGRYLVEAEALDEDGGRARALASVHIR